MREDLERSAHRIKQLQDIIQNNLSTTREALSQLKDDQIYCLRVNYKFLKKYFDFRPPSRQP